MNLLFEIQSNFKYKTITFPRFGACIEVEECACGSFTFWPLLASSGDDPKKYLLGTLNTNMIFLYTSLSDAKINS